MCPSCHGQGEVHFSPSHTEVRCSKCGGRGWLTPPPLAAPQTPPDLKSDADIVQTLRTRSGAAYAAGDDERAQRLRQAADLVEGR